MNLIQTIVLLTSLLFAKEANARWVPKQIVSSYVESQLNLEYDSCLTAWNDVSKWCIVIYGDWYGNSGGNTMMYYAYHLLFDKIPRWINLCYKPN